MKSDLIGREATITAKDSYLNGEWGIIKYYDGRYYHIAPWNGTETMVFERKEFKVRRDVSR